MLDGNKRIGTHAMLVFLALNGIELSYTQKELYEIILEVASGKEGYEGINLERRKTLQESKAGHSTNIQDEKTGESEYNNPS